jgi:hypothetical protein
MRNSLLRCGLAALFTASLTAQSFTSTAVAATNIVVQSQLQPAGPQSATIPTGTVLQDQQSIQVGAAPLAFASFRAVLPSPGISQFEGRCSAEALNTATVQGAVRVTLQSPAPTALDLQLSAVNPGSLFLGSIDVHDDGTPELTTFSTSLSVNTSAVFGPASLPIRITMSGSAPDTTSSLDLEVRVLARLTAASTPYVAGCGGPTIAIAPTNTATLRAGVAQLPPGGLAALVIGLGQTSIQLPFGGCQLGVTPDLVAHVNLDPVGAGAKDIPVPRSLTGITANLQAVGLDLTAPGVVTTSDALTVQVTR